MPHFFSCAVCGDEYDNPGKGRAPARCVYCDPKAWSPGARDEALRRRRELESFFKAGGPPKPKPKPLLPGAPVSEQPRLALSIAVRNVGRAKGVTALIGALLSLEDVAKQWRKSL